MEMRGRVGEWEKEPRGRGGEWGSGRRSESRL